MGVLMWLVSYIESGHLAALDDTLPPKLISGELRAKQVGMETP